VVDIFEGFLKNKIICKIYLNIVFRLIDKRFLMFKKEKRTINLLTALLQVSYSNNKDTNNDM